MWAIGMWAHAPHYSVDLQIQLYPLKYGKLGKQYPWIYGYFYSVVQFKLSTKLALIDSISLAISLPNQPSVTLHNIQQNDSVACIRP